MKRAMVSFSVARIAGWMTRVVQRQRRGRDVETAPPDLGLRLAMLRGGFGLVQALERSIVALVQPPRLGHRNPELIQDVERDSQRLDRPLQHRRVGHVKDIAAFREKATRFARFVAAAVGQVDVVPAGKPVLFVPGALAVTEQYDLIHACGSSD